jgi:hypothetical protein
MRDFILEQIGFLNNLADELDAECVSLQRGGWSTKSCEFLTNKANECRRKASECRQVLSLSEYVKT